MPLRGRAPHETRTSTLSVPVKVEAQHITYNDGSAIGAGSDGTSDFERGGGMRLNVDTLLAQRKNEIEQLRFVDTTKKISISPIHNVLHVDCAWRQDGGILALHT